MPIVIHIELKFYLGAFVNLWLIRKNIRDYLNALTQLISDYLISELTVTFALIMTMV